MMAEAIIEVVQKRVVLFNNVPTHVQEYYIDPLWEEFGIVVTRVCAPDRGAHFHRDPTVDLYIACIEALSHSQYALLKPFAKGHGVPLVALDRQRSNWGVALKVPRVAYSPLPNARLKKRKERQERQSLALVPAPPPLTLMPPIEEKPELPMFIDDHELSRMFEEENVKLTGQVAALTKKREMQAGTMAAQTKTIKKLEAEVAALKATPQATGSESAELEKRRAIIVEREARIQQLVKEVQEFEKSNKELRMQLTKLLSTTELRNKTEQLRRLGTRVQELEAQLLETQAAARRQLDQKRDKFPPVVNVTMDEHLRTTLLGVQHLVKEGLLTSEEALNKLMKKMIKETL